MVGGVVDFGAYSGGWGGGVGAGFRVVGGLEWGSEFFSLGICKGLYGSHLLCST